MKYPALLPAILITSLTAVAQSTYIGFDKNGYPGDDLLPALHRSFAYTGYWLNDPPGMTSNPWVGKRSVVRAAGFGFLILFDGRLDAQLRDQDGAELGREDAASAIRAAKIEGLHRCVDRCGRSLDIQGGCVLLGNCCAFGTSDDVDCAGHRNPLPRRKTLGVERPMSAGSGLCRALRGIRPRKERLPASVGVAVCAISAPAGRYRRVPANLRRRRSLLCLGSAAF